MTTKTESVPLINPDANDQVVKMFRQSIISHSADITFAEVTLEKFDESVDDFGLSITEMEIVCEGLWALIRGKEESIIGLQETIDKLAA